MEKTNEVENSVKSAEEDGAGLQTSIYKELSTSMRRKERTNLSVN